MFCRQIVVMLYVALFCGRYGNVKLKIRLFQNVTIKLNVRENLKTVLMDICWSTKTLLLHNISTMSYRAISFSKTLHGSNRHSSTKASRVIFANSNKYFFRFNHFTGRSVAVFYSCNVLKTIVTRSRDGIFPRFNCVFYISRDPVRARNDCFYPVGHRVIPLRNIISTIITFS